MFITLCAILGLPCLIAAYFRQRPGETICFSLGCITVFLYCFYALNALATGFAVLSLLLIGCYLAAVPQLVQTVKKEGAASLCVFFSPGLCVFLITAVLVRFLTKGAVSVLWDELRLWSAVPKALFLTDSLQLGKDALIFPSMQSYLPGIGLLEYFFQRLVGQYQDDWTFFVYGMTGAACLLPVAEKISWKHWWLTIGYAVIIALFPLVFYNRTHMDVQIYYRTLFIDGLLGFALSYSLYCAWQCDFSSWFGMLRYIVSIALMMLLKESGILLSTISLLAAFGIFATREKKAWSRCIGTITACIAAIIFVKVSWSYLLSAYDVDATGSWISLSGVFSAVFSPSANQKLIWKKFGELLLTGELLGRRIIPFLSTSWTGILFVYAVFCVAFVGITRRRQLVFPLLFGAVAELLYTFSMVFLFMYWNAFDSYQRYMNTGVLAMCALAMVILLDTFLSQVNRRQQLGLLCLFTVLLLVFSIPRNPMKIQESLTAEYQAESAVTERMENILRTEEDNSSLISVFLINAGDINSVLSHHQVYNQLLNKRIAVRNWCYDTSLNPEDPDDTTYLYDRLANAGHGRYEYLYITDREVEEGYLYQLYASQFEGGAAAVVSGGVYRIDYDDIQHSVKFIFCGNAHA